MEKNNLINIHSKGKDHSKEVIDFLKISIASPKNIRSWSFGEVKKPETINYRTFKPERDGLFCSRIFGPMKDYECLCGKYKRIKYKGVICEKCGTEVTLAKVRRERMAHIDLASPVAHIWFSKATPSKMAILLDLSIKALESILYFESYIVISPGITNLVKGQILSEHDYEQALEKFDETDFEVSIGADAFKIILQELNLPELSKQLRSELEQNISDLKKKKIFKRLKVVEAFIKSGTKPDWMILDVLPVIPPDLRPLVPLDGGRFATSDLNDLYRRVINRNNRLKKLIELSAPDIIIRNEKRMLQEAVDALFDNGRRGRVIVGSNKRPLKSLSDMLKGKQGRFRQNLLGKRVDYSGRSVIVVGPTLKLHQCGLPKKMALELFRPFVYSKLEKRGLVSTIKNAKRFVEKGKEEVWDCLAEVIREHPILLNRAPTLHRLGIQAFEPILIEGNALQLHPLVCTAFNADFDGDTMSVHVPLSIEAQVECRVLIMASNNILSPSNGKPIITPTKDIILGLYYLSIMREKEVGEGIYFGSVGEVEKALEDKFVSLHAKVFYRSLEKQNGKLKSKVFETTPGRILLSSIIPENYDIDFNIMNKLIIAKEINGLFKVIYDTCGQKQMVIFADRIMKLGFKYATKSGISFGKDDLIIPEEKKDLVNQSVQKTNEFEQQYLDGLITRGEKYNKVVDEWSRCTDQVANKMMDKLSNIQPGKPINSIYMMADSGARGSIAQMKQLSGMRGLMARTTGEIIETPIVSNFKEGLNVLEYFNSTHGARKGLSDTALKTANAGYLTRRLVDIAQDVVVREHDCGVKEGIKITAVLEGADMVVELSDRVLGRVIAEDIKDPITEEVIASQGVLIDDFIAEEIKSRGVNSVFVRSAITCKLEYGICAACYGQDLARGGLVNVGEVVGVIAAQSIGEPGTQLTLRTFHIGGAAQASSVRSSIESPFDGTIHIKNKNIVKNSQGKIIILSRNSEVVIKDDRGIERVSYPLPYGSYLLKKDKSKINHGEKIVEWDPYALPIISEFQGVISFKDLVPEVSLKENFDEETGISNLVVMDWQQQSRGSKLNPRIQVLDTSGDEDKLSTQYSLPVDSILAVKDKQTIKQGDIIARVTRESSRTRDITGGLPRVAELFEARKPKDYAILSEEEGIIRFKKDYKGKKHIAIQASNNNVIDLLVPKNRSISVIDGDFIQKGDKIVDGPISGHDVLRVSGVEKLTHYLVKEVQDVYRLQGVELNDKHIEIVIRQMIRKIEVKDAGDSGILEGEVLNVSQFNKTNEKLKSLNKKLMTGTRILQGLTRASLNTESFLSAASFQETTRVLTEAATEGKTDKLLGLKENIIVGRLIPAGTGVANEMLLQKRKDILLNENVTKEVVNKSID